MTQTPQSRPQTQHTYNELADKAMARLEEFCNGRNLDPDHLSRHTVARLMVEFYELLTHD